MSDHMIEQLWGILKRGYDRWENKKDGYTTFGDDEAEFIRLLGQHRWTVPQLDARKSGEISWVSLNKQICVNVPRL